MDIRLWIEQNYLWSEVALAAGIITLLGMYIVRRRYKDAWHRGVQTLENNAIRQLPYVSTLKDAAGEFCNASYEYREALGQGNQERAARWVGTLQSAETRFWLASAEAVHVVERHTFPAHLYTMRSWLWHCTKRIVRDLLPGK